METEIADLAGGRPIPLHLLLHIADLGLQRLGVLVAVFQRVPKLSGIAHAVACVSTKLIILLSARA
jgi:hypothetical protein